MWRWAVLLRRLASGSGAAVTGRDGFGPPGSAADGSHYFGKIWSWERQIYRWKWRRRRTKAGTRIALHG